MAGGGGMRLPMPGGGGGASASAPRGGRPVRRPHAVHRRDGSATASTGGDAPQREQPARPARTRTGREECAGGPVHQLGAGLLVERLSRADREAVRRGQDGPLPGLHRLGAAARPAPRWGRSTARTTRRCTSTPTFFDDMLSGQLGAKGGPFAIGYVIAHEYGHHIEDQLGILGRMRTQRGPEERRRAGRADGRLPRRGLGQGRAGDHRRAGRADHQRAQPGRHHAGHRRGAGGGRRPDPEAGAGRVDTDSFTHGTAASGCAGSTAACEQGTIKGCDTFAPTTCRGRHGTRRQPSTSPPPLRRAGARGPRGRGRPVRVGPGGAGRGGARGATQPGADRPAARRTPRSTWPSGQARTSRRRNARGRPSTPPASTARCARPRTDGWGSARSCTPSRRASSTSGAASGVPDASPVVTLGVNEVVPGLAVLGPDPELEDEMRELHERAFRRG